MNVLRDVCVWMKAKDLRHLLIRHVVDLLNVNVVAIVTLREPVKLADDFVFTVGVVRIKNFIRQEIFKKGHQHALVCALCHTTTIVALADEVLESIERHFFVLIDEIVQLSHRNLKVTRCKVVVLIPAKRAIITSLKQDSMEHGQTKGDSLEVS